MTLIDTLDDDLKRAVGNVRDAAEKLWAVPEHKYYTDHTVKHSDRVIKYLYGLISKHQTVNNDNFLSNYEIYILLSAAYLHDIGMQIIKEETNLEKLREIHNEVTYTYILNSIDGSKEYPDMGLIHDPTLTKYVAEVARAHRRVNIHNNCSEQSTYQGDIIRPRVLGALLRLADALDIDRRRIIWERLKLAPISANTRYHWFCCYYVDGVEVKNKGIRITYSLPPKSIYNKLLVPIIQNNIKAAIQEVQEILYNHGVTLILRDEQIGYNEKREEMPADVSLILWHEYELCQRTLESSPIQGLAREVQFWLEVLGYVVENWEKDDESYIDLVVRKQNEPEDQLIHVRCCDGEIQQSHVQAFESESESHSIIQKWIISWRRAASSAETYALSQGKIKVFTLPTLINMIFAPYYKYLDDLIKETGIDNYIELACEVPSINKTGNIIHYDSHPYLDVYVDNWLKEDGQHQLSILGEYGTGKTWFCRHYALNKIDIFKVDPVNNRLPLLIRLRDYTSFDSLSELITDFVENKCGIAKPGSYEVFQRLNKDGRLLLLLDGFDEMGAQIDEEITKNHFNELSEAVTKNSKVIFTCRKEYFHTEAQAVELLSGKRGDSCDTNRPNFDLLYIKDLSDEQIKRILYKRVGTRWKAYWSTIRKVYDLPDLVKRPVMLDMVINAHNELKDCKSINHAKLYQIYTDQWIEKDIIKNRTLLDVKSKRYFAQEIAWEMFSRRKLTIPFEDIKDLVSKYLDSIPENQGNIDFLEHDIRTASFISKRDARGRYEFVHKSFMEFFAAQKLAKAIRHKIPKPVKQQEVYYEIIRFLYNMIDADKDVPTLLNWLANKQNPEKLRANAIRISGQWVREDVLMNLLDLAENRQEKVPLIRDSIRSIVRMLHGEEVDWIRKVDIKYSISAYAIRTDRSTLDVMLLPIKIKLVHTQAVTEARRMLLRKYSARVTSLLKMCLSADQPDQVRQNASFAFIHFVRKQSLPYLTRCALKDNNYKVRFNCCVALIVGGSTSGKTLMNTLISSSGDVEIKRLGKENLKRLELVK